MAKKKQDIEVEEEKRGYCVDCKLKGDCAKAIGKYFGFCINSYVPKEEKAQ